METSTLSPKIRLLLVDDHIVMRMGLVTATEAEPDMEVVGEAANGLQALEAYQRLVPDVVILDLRMPKQGGIETIHQLRSRESKAKIIIFSNYKSGDDIFQAYKAGALGFVVKEMPLEQLMEAIRAVHAGERYVPAEISTFLSNRVISELSTREIEVLGFVAKGLSNKEIGSAMKIVEGTVKIHLTSILSKLNVSDRTQAAILGIKRGIIHLE